MAQPSSDYEVTTVHKYLNAGMPKGKFVCYLSDNTTRFPVRVRYFVVDGKFHRGKPAIVVDVPVTKRVIYEEYWQNGIPVKTVWQSLYHSIFATKDAAPFVVEQFYEDRTPDGLVAPNLEDIYLSYKVGFGAAYSMSRPWIGRKESEGPAEIMSDGSVAYYRKGMLHAKKVAAVQHAEPYFIKEEYFVRNVNTRSNGPAIVYRDGSYEYLQDGVLHNAYGPAQYHAQTKTYRFLEHGLLHRIAAPAVLNFAKNSGEFWTKGKLTRTAKLSELNAVQLSVSNMDDFQKVDPFSKIQPVDLSKGKGLTALFNL
jgi:hypothetical protein